MGEAIASRSLRGWQEIIAARDGRRLRARTSAARILLRVTSSNGKLTKALRKGLNPRRPLAMIGLRLMHLAVFLGLDAERALAAKHPGHCVYCTVEQDCGCVKDPDRHKKVMVVNPNPEPRPLAVLQASLERTYGKQNREDGIGEVSDHFNEEIGELADEILEGNLENTDEEFADAIAWWLAKVNLLNLIADELLYEAFNAPDPTSSYLLTPRS